MSYDSPRSKSNFQDWEVQVPALIDEILTVDNFLQDDVWSQLVCLYEIAPFLASRFSDIVERIISKFDVSYRDKLRDDHLFSGLNADSCENVNEICEFRETYPDIIAHFRKSIRYALAHDFVLRDEQHGIYRAN